MEIYIVKILIVILMSCIISLFFFRPKKMKDLSSFDFTAGMRIEYIVMAFIAIFVLFLINQLSKESLNDKFLMNLIIFISVVCAFKLVKKSNG